MSCVTTNFKVTYQAKKILVLISVRPPHGIFNSNIPIGLFEFHVVHIFL